MIYEEPHDALSRRSPRDTRAAAVRQIVRAAHNVIPFLQFRMPHPSNQPDAAGLTQGRFIEVSK